MTTIIYGCPSEDAFTDKEATLLANIYQESEYKKCDDLGPENWDDKLIITTAEEDEIIGFAEEDMVPYADALKLVENEPETKPGNQQPVLRPPCMTVTDGIDLVALLIENELCAEETPEYIKADLRVLAQIIKILQSAYPFTATDEITDFAHRLYAAEMETRSMCELIFALSRDIKKGKFHITRSKQNAGAHAA